MQELKMKPPSLARSIAIGELMRVAEICAPSRSAPVRGLGLLLHDRARNLLFGIAKPFPASTKQLRVLRRRP
jgi:hypothetical protein